MIEAAGRETRQRLSFRRPIQAGNHVLHEFLVVFHRFDAQENPAKDHRGDQKQDEGATIPGLSGPHRERHGETAAEQDDSIRGAQPNIQNVAAALKRGEIEPAINGVGGKQPAEEHDFGDQENPDSQGVGVLLLLQILKLVRQSGVLRVRFGVSHQQPPLAHRRTLPRLPREFPRSFPWAAETTSSIQGPWRPTGLVPRSGRSASTRSGKPVESSSRRTKQWRPPKTSRSTLEIPPDKTRTGAACPDSRE